MIAKLSGVVDSTGVDWAVIDVAGVGYLVSCSGATLRSLPPAGGQAGLLVETQLREDRIHLYGFLEEVERDWFRLLVTVQGVGAKVALAILTVLSPHALAQAIAAQDRTGLTEAEGVGPKLAARIVNELKEKAGAIALGPAARLAAVGAAAPAEGAADAVSALVNLGYRRTEAFGVVAHAAQRLGNEAPVAELIRAGLKELGS